MSGAVTSATASQRIGSRCHGEICHVACVCWCSVSRPLPSPTLPVDRMVTRAANRAAGGDERTAVAAAWRCSERGEGPNPASKQADRSQLEEEIKKVRESIMQLNFQMHELGLILSEIFVRLSPIVSPSVFMIQSCKPHHNIGKNNVNRMLPLKRTSDAYWPSSQETKNSP